MEIKNSAFSNGGKIPIRFTCSGESINPNLKISGVPAKAKTLALIVDDPDAPSGTFIHWLVWNISPKTKEIKGNASGIGVEGITDAGEIGYTPPCPPHGPSHTYRFKLYALDTMLALDPGADVSQLEMAIKGHTLEMAEIDGEFARG